MWKWHVIRRKPGFNGATRAVIIVTLFWVAVSCSSAQDAAAQSPSEELARGNYSAAIAGFQRVLSTSPADQSAQIGLVTALLETGRYAETEKELKRFLASKPETPALRLLYGDVLAATGRYREALAEFETAGKSARGSLRLRADFRRAEVLNTIGQVQPAQEVFRTVVQNQDSEEQPTAESMTIAAGALTYLEKYKEATDLYLDAIEKDSNNIEAQLSGGELFTAKYNYAEAAEFFRDALRINANSARAHLGIAQNKRIEGGDEMRAALARALEINPSYVAAKALSAMLDLEAERYDKAATTLDEALKINPNSLEAHSLRAAMFYLQNRTPDFEAEVKTTLAINPAYGPLYATLEHFATNTRRYTQAVEFSRRAIALSPRLWSAHLSLGIALTRVGMMDQGRASIETSFEGDPFNIWAKNTLDLLDTMRDYREVQKGAFFIKTGPTESDVLTPYAGDLLEEVSRSLTAKYKFTPKTPIWIEIFPNHEDFAVRTLGLPGLGALGVCFGQVIAEDSPSARPGGQFNWGSTLWHEYTHVVTLQITDHLIPRWFSEGLSVYEERRARPGWGDDWNIAVLKAFAEGRWFKTADLDAGFMRPRRPDDVPLAYFQASQVCEFITERYGFDAILEMLKRYREHGKTPEIIQQVLKVSEAEFDRVFSEYITSKVGRYVKAVEGVGKRPPTGQPSKEAVLSMLNASPDDFALNLRAAVSYLAEGNTDKAVAHFKRSIELFPFQTGAESAYEQLAQVYEKRGDRAAAVEVLDALVKVDENNYPALKKLAQLRAELGDKSRALESLRQSFYINPFEYSAHALAGTLGLELNQPDTAMREFQIALALKPPNPAEAYYNLATAQLAAGKSVEAKRSILRSLEAAPGFEKAQDLLLRLTRP